MPTALIVIDVQEEYFSGHPPRRGRCAPMPGVDGRAIDAETLHNAALAPLALIGVDLTLTDDWRAALPR